MVGIPSLEVQWGGRSRADIRLTDATCRFDTCIAYEDSSRSCRDRHRNIRMSWPCDDVQQSSSILFVLSTVMEILNIFDPTASQASA
jgi:hypothetical protein